MQLKTTNDIYHHLNSLGLTLNEAEIYVYLLRSGLTLGSHIHKDLKKDKSSTYRALGNLIDHNLVYKVGESRNQKFGANPEENLLTIVEAKKNKLDETSLHLKNFLKTIQNQSKSKFKKNNVTIFEGPEGYKLFMQARLEDKNPLIREVANRTELEKYFSNQEEYDKYMKSYIQKRVDKNISLNVLMDKRDDKDYIDINSKKWLKKARVIPGNSIFKAFATSWKNKVGFFSEENSQVICVIIEDEFITSLFNTMFDLIWEISKENKGKTHEN